MNRYSLLLALSGAFLLAGCGQSGPLYLPGNPSEIRNAPQPVESGQDDEDEDKDKDKDR